MPLLATPDWHIKTTDIEFVAEPENLSHVALRTLAREDSKSLEEVVNLQREVLEKKKMKKLISSSDALGTAQVDGTALRHGGMATQNLTGRV